MCSGYRDAGLARLIALVLVVLSAAAIAALPGSAKGPLRVCADPENPPFSTRDQAGFENRIAALVAQALDTTVSYYWWPQRRGFIRNTLDAHACDVVIGVPADTDGVLTTAPYYRAGYVFAYRADRVRDLRSYDDPRLPELQVGLPLVLDDQAATPPAHSLARRGILDNVIGYPPIGQGSVAERMMRALADGTLDVAILWAPEAAWFARQQTFDVTLVPAVDGSSQVQSFPIAMAVRKDDQQLHDALAEALARRRPEIDAILRDYGLASPGVVNGPHATSSP
jgi:mxaJ protein